MSEKFEREIRYAVFKLKDVEKYFSKTERQILDMLAQKIYEERGKEGRRNFQCAVVEDDWPEYEAVWKAIEYRCSGIYPHPPKVERKEHEKDEHGHYIA